MIRALFLLALVAGLSFAARSFVPEGAPGSGSTALAFGFLLLAAIQAGHIFHRLHLPHLTGFLLTGLLFGPEVLGLLSHEMVGDLTLVKKVAVGMIALSAGCELNLVALRPRLRVVGRITVLGLVLAGALLWGFLFVISEQLEFAAGMTEPQRAIVALIGANVLVALSPAVVIGIVSETSAAGPLTELGLSLVVLADLVVVITFTFSESIARIVFPGLAGDGGVGSLATHILGSLGIGAGLGMVLAVFVQRVGRKLGLFVFGALFVIAEAGSAVHIDPLLVGLAAGLFLENVSSVSGALVAEETKSASLPTLAVFFAVVGAEIHLHAFREVAAFAIGCAVLRAIGLWTGARLAARGTGLEPDLARRIPFGMFPQAGVAIALALLVGQKFAPWGAALSTLLLSTIMVNELIGPILWRHALVRAGEVGRRDSSHLAAAPHARRAKTEGLP
jgi:Kef-type K+ transport system membrane component KefB